MTTLNKKELFKSDGCFDGQWRIDGYHPDLGGGVLSYHSNKVEAEHNAKLINVTGGDADVIANTYRAERPPWVPATATPVKEKPVMKRRRITVHLSRKGGI